MKTAILIISSGAVVSGALFLAVMLWFAWGWLRRQWQRRPKSQRPDPHIRHLTTISYCGQQIIIN